jgi:hypothetical protein
MNPKLGEEKMMKAGRARADEINNITQFGSIVDYNNAYIFSNYSVS